MDLAKWQSENGQYLAASVAWLRLRLRELALESDGDLGSDRDSATGESGACERKSFWQWIFGGGPPDPPAKETGSWHVRRDELSHQIKQAADERQEAARMEPPPALHLLEHSLQLSPFERDLLLLCAATELDTRIATLCSRANGSPEAAYPTFALALSALESPNWEALSPHRPLRYWNLVETASGTGRSLTASPLLISERIVHYIKGLNSLDSRLAEFVTAEELTGTDLPDSQREHAERMRTRLERAPEADPRPVAIMLGSDVTAKRLIARHVASHLERRLYRVAAESLAQQPDEVTSLARLWQRESSLLPLALFVDAHGEGLSPEVYRALDRFVAAAVRSDCVVMLGSREPLARMSFDGFTTDIGRPTVLEQRAEWAAALSSAGIDSQDSIAARLACQYGLNTPEIRRIVLETPAEPAETLGDRLWDACRNRSRPRLDTLAQRIDPKATWDDLVVTDETYYLLREIVSQSRTRDTVYEDWGFAKRMNRGLGISALFAGESGTGKTMAAEVIANELHLSLYRIDLSQVVSKYIGETEKNLQRVFDLMEGGGSILFFDEADALFGKRSEVRDSHDRYANIEINYLLQRMESYTGLAILATNMKSALDKAFIRRLRFIVTFEFPGPAERKAIWQKAFPEEVPRAELDYDRLARLHCTGASIHSIALSAAFRAAKAKGPVDMETVMMAARTEFRKMERPVSEADLLVKK